MRRSELADLTAFLAVAEERSFTRAAAKLGTSQSSLSHTVRRLEAELGLRLLSRTTRSVSLTEAGEQLIQTLSPAFDEIDAKLNALTRLRETPAGTVRITTSRHAADTILWPAVAGLVQRYPDIKVELSIDSSFTDIVSARFDAGVRLGESVAKDMIAVRIGPDLRMAVVGSPDYFAKRPAPQTPHDLTHHACINLRFLTSGGLYAWEFEHEGREVNVRVDGPLILNDSAMVRKAAEAGLGLAFVMEDQVAAQIAEGKLVRVLEDWSPYFSGHHLYYPSRRQPSAAFTALLEALRYRGTGTRGS